MTDTQLRKHEKGLFWPSKIRARGGNTKMNLETTKTKIKGIPSQIYQKVEDLREIFKQKNNMGEKGFHSSHFFHLFHIFGAGTDQEIDGSQDDDHVLSPPDDIPVIIIEDDEPSHQLDTTLPSSSFSLVSGAGKKQDYYVGLHAIKPREPFSHREEPQDDVSTPWSYISKVKFLKPPQ